MKTLGLCHSCGKPTMLSCPFCGRLVCRQCYDGKHGICNDCKTKGQSGFERKF